MQNTEGMIYLIACALHGTEPDPMLLAEMDLAGVYKLAKRHSLSALCWYGLGKSKNLVPEEMRGKWENKLYASMRKNALMDVEREKFCKFCEGAGIRYMPLKGTVLQYLYPAPGTREMADNDILFDVAHDEEVKDYFYANGWSVEAFRIGNHDIYKKEPFYNFELHRGLFVEATNEVWARYYQDPFKHATPDKKSGFGYCFHEEDFYAYIMTHACKHHSGGGTGIRNLVDCYVCRHKLPMERKYVEFVLNELEILDFEREALELSEKLFADPAKVMENMRGFSENEQKALDYYIASGVYGTTEHRINNEMKKIAPEEETFTLRTKLRYLGSRMFPGQEAIETWCAARAPFFVRHRWLMWFAPFWRIISKGMNHTAELKIVFEKSDQKVK